MAPRPPPLGTSRETRDAPRSPGQAKRRYVPAPDGAPRSGARGVRCRCARRDLGRGRRLPHGLLEPVACGVRRRGLRGVRQDRHRPRHPDHRRPRARRAAGPSDTAADALAQVLAALGLRGARVGLDDAALSRAAAGAIAARLAGVRVTPAVGIVARARAVKGPYEIDCLAQALRIAEESIHAVLGELKAGTTEREAVEIHEHAVAARNATPYATTITFGENTALPAAYPTERALRASDLVRFDLGCIFKGYRGDVARMAVLGEPGECEQRAYDAVEAGVQAGLDAIRPGVHGGAVFDAAVAGVRAAGLPEFRRHHAGHGIGLEPAEAPWLRPGGDPLEAGMVLRVETPYYELGGFGVNVKETVLVTRGGGTVVNRSHRGLVILD